MSTLTRPVEVLTPCCDLPVQVEGWDFSATSVEIPTPCDCSPVTASVTMRVSAVRQFGPPAHIRHRDGFVTFDAPASPRCEVCGDDVEVCGR